MDPYKVIQYGLAGKAVVSNFRLYVLYFFVVCGLIGLFILFK